MFLKQVDSDPLIQINEMILDLEHILILTLRESSHIHNSLYLDLQILYQVTYISFWLPLIFHRVKLIGCLLINTHHRAFQVNALFD